MQIKHITDSFAVSPQITLDDLQAIKNAGFTTVISARPDGEEPGQPSFADVKAAAIQAGLTAIHIPIIPGQATTQDVQKMDAALSQADGPVFGFCKGGPRAESLYRATGR